jgi:hypothetical protein
MPARSPNSSISSSEASASAARGRAARRYLAIVLGVALATALLAAWTGWRLGPPAGDLARIGGYSERLFGPQDPPLGFPEGDAALVALPALEAGEGGGAILVFGDSFSIPKGDDAGWTDALAALTGAPVRVVRSTGFGGLLAYLRSEAVRADPPRALVLQTVERAAWFRAAALHRRDDCAPPAPPRRAALGPVRDPRRTAEAGRGGFSGFDQLMSRGALALRTRITGGEQPVYELALRPGPEGARPRFSSAAPGRLLILGADVNNQTPDVYADWGRERAARRAVCGLRRLAAAAQAAGIPFRVAMAPDKRTAYAPWIADPLPPPHLDLFQVYETALGPLFVDLLAPLRAAIAAGETDVYLPNDTHWGSSGAEIAARAVLARLAEGRPPE